MPLGDRVSVELEVPFHDLDPMRIVWHGNYYKYVEISRTALMREHRLDGPDVMQTGYSMVVIEKRTGPKRDAAAEEERRLLVQVIGEFMADIRAIKGTAKK